MVCNDRLLSLGLDPITLEDGLLREVGRDRPGVAPSRGPDQDSLPVDLERRPRRRGRGRSGARGGRVAGRTPGGAPRAPARLRPWLQRRAPRSAADGAGMVGRGVRRARRPAARRSRRPAHMRSTRSISPPSQRPWRRPRRSWAPRPRTRTAARRCGPSPRPWRRGGMARRPGSATCRRPASMATAAAAGRSSAIPPRPVSAEAHRRIATERAWLDLGRTHGLAVNLFPPAGHLRARPLSARPLARAAI